MTTNLDMKNGEFFEAATEYLYQKKIEELQAEVARLTNKGLAIKLVALASLEGICDLLRHCKYDEAEESAHAAIEVINETEAVPKIEELQAQLATAVEALEKIAGCCADDSPSELSYEANIATEALARIRKGSE